MWEDFKKFALKGNVLDLAIGVVIGGAFGKIVTSLVNNIITPLIGKIFGAESAFKDLQYWGIEYGAFIQSVFDFFIIAFSIFMFIRIASKLDFRKKEEEVEPEALETTDDVLKDIRELLREQTKK
ncbi:large conductance mechanosensitive channel protein MscL [Kurthia sibirica]|uniref:Large-conductance mechanosensitive channel n=1 Tax=Kurthia sibirica TaxID=202750 RepID=A0A2U3ALI1_9BACL|nr:large conductance mechanosensitive channel protein MscL [Kurthia sibirica]PWI25396.1 large conductance mechanosensitive channel protein MscL [Kurthia sibirica]GEK35640.1 large-conductance mechanosensitive channel [Kurthia sibirica]